MRDTTPEMQRIHDEMIMRLSPGERILMALEASEFGRALMKARRVSETRPEWGAKPPVRPSTEP